MSVRVVWLALALALLSTACGDAGAPEAGVDGGPTVEPSGWVLEQERDPITDEDIVKASASVSDDTGFTSDVELSCVSAVNGQRLSATWTFFDADKEGAELRQVAGAMQVPFARAELRIGKQAAYVYAVSYSGLAYTNQLRVLFTAAEATELSDSQTITLRPTLLSGEPVFVAELDGNSQQVLRACRSVADAPTP